MDQYQTLEQPVKDRKRLIYALSIISLLCLIATILAIVFGIQASNNDNDSNSSSSECTTSSCIALADAVLESIDTSVDPCDDFYAYACGNWIDSNDWDLVETSSYSQFAWLQTYEMEQLFDGLFYNTNASLVGHSSVGKAQTFFESCYVSTVSEESFEESGLLTEFFEKVNFTRNGLNSDTWDQYTQTGFTEALSWLTVRGWNYMFGVSVLQQGVPLITQNYQVVMQYNSTRTRKVINETYVPLYESLFGLSGQEATQMGQDVGELMDAVYNIATFDIFYYYGDQTLYSYYLRAANLSDWNALFGQSAVLNITEILFETFDTSPSDVYAVLYYQPGLEYFSNLTSLLESASPDVVQYFLYTNVLLYGMNYESSLEQSRLISRLDFCFAQLIEQFPFVYGYILDHVLFGTQKYNAVYDLVNEILENGIRTVINEAVFTWMDAESLTNSIKKVDYLGIYVGLPPQIGNYTALDIYYSPVSQSNSTFINNLAQLLEFSVYTTRSAFNGAGFDLISPWPSSFNDASSYGSWLTGINAFYVPSANFFTIPVTIAQVPFFDASYPSAINFGGLGGVIGHEISHGFDPDGSQYNYNGTNVDIWTATTRSNYEEVTDCFVNQYNGFELPGSYVNGTETITENVADNGGVSASYTAWRHHISSKGNDQTLPGVDLTSTQLFYWSWAHVWCEAARSDYYAGWNDVHSPNPARVWGVVQNSDAFAEAYGCESGSAMNPEDKCVLW